MNNETKELIRQLQLVGDAANAHTINKAVYHLPHIKDHARPDFEKLVRECLATKEWKPLSLRMAKWW